MRLLNCIILVFIMIFFFSYSFADQVFSLIEPNSTMLGNLADDDFILGDGSYMDIFFFDCSDDDIVSVSMNSSDFDTYLFFIDPQSNLISDDDSGPDLNSLISDYSVRGNGTCYIIAKSYSSRITAAYEIDLKLQRSARAFFDSFDYNFSSRNSPNGIWSKVADAWSYCTYKEEHVWTSGSNLVIRVPSNLRECGQIVSAQSNYLYGSYRAKIKASNIPGVVNAFFYYLNDSSEIDIEILTNQNRERRGKVHFVVHPSSSSSSCRARNSHCEFNLRFNPSDAFHEYGFDWYPNRVEFFVDGRRVHTIRVNVPSTHGTIRLNNWTGNPIWGGGPPTTDALMYVDYVTYRPFQ